LRNEVKDRSRKVRRASQIAWLIAIIAASAAVGMIVAWRAPGVNLYARDWLMRARGPLLSPNDIVIIAIDEASIARFGRFPWPRSLTARALEKLAASQTKAVALDVLYIEPTTSVDDSALAESIKQAGNVVVASQLVDMNDQANVRRNDWLRPLPAIESAAAGVGHVNVLTGQDGVARELLLREADDDGLAVWAMAVETIRVGDGVSESDVRDVPGAVRIGARTLPVQSDARTVMVEAKDASAALETLRADRMRIDYIGPTGSFAERAYSFADVIDGRISPEVFRGKYVLIGATAATLGERVASPFVHSESADGNQHGSLMPGVEVLANSINTILRARFYHETPDWIATLCAALAAAAVLGLLTIAQGRFETVKQLGVLCGLVTVILVLAYFAFARWLIVPPVVPALVSLATAAPLALLRRSLVTSADLDAQIGELAGAGASFSLGARHQTITNYLHSSPASLIARLAKADAVAIFARNVAGSSYHLVAANGAPVVSSFAEVDPRKSVAEAVVRNEPASNYFSFARAELAHVRQNERALTLGLGDADMPSGALLIAYPVEREPSSETLRLCIEIAASFVALAAADGLEAERDSISFRGPSWWRLPRGIEWKARTLGVLNRRMLARARFVDRALRSVEDGLIVASVEGRIAFVNPRAAAILGAPEHALIGSDLFERIGENECGSSASDEPRLDRAKRETLVRLVVERAPVEREIVISEGPTRYYMLRLSAVCDEDEGTGAVLGIVASLSDITKQRELQQMKNDVMALVSHELRTPLTAIQGMSEVLAQFEVDADRRREMHLAINDEAKRLARMIDDYLDITRLESGARPLRLTPVRVAPLIERALLMLDPIAAQREIRILRRFAPNLPALLADADLIAQAVTNLVANAIKYSPCKTEVFVEVRADFEALWVEVTDHGYGIPSDVTGRIFEKFYRVPRIEDADVPGTGLGLAFVREIAELHGGRITVESEPGVGSTFSLRLPLQHKGR
jgi:PAS domain S-box-containing protein